MGTDCSGTDFGRAVLRGCALQSAHVEGVNLARAMLVSCNADETTWRGADLSWTNTSGTSFTRANFSGAHRFFLCREIVCEILLRHVGDDDERAAMVGMLQTKPQWCYREWKQYLDRRPEYRELALGIFAAYPESGCGEALRAGWRPPAPRKLAQID
jgi:hypothetical protein